MTNRRIAVILNAKARSGQKLFDRVSELVGDEAEFIVLSRRPQDQHEAIERAKREGIENVWIGGGDGSVRAAASALAGTSVVLSILPLGTGNALAHELEIPMEIEAAIHFHLYEARIRYIDVGTFNDEVFVNVATLGLTSRIMEQVQASDKGTFGRLVYLPAVARAYSATRPFQIRVETNEGTFDGNAMQFVAASTRLHAGPFPVSRDAEIDDGRLSIYVVEATTQKNLMRYGAALLLGQQTRLPEVWNVETELAKVTLQRTRRFVVDGDAFKAKTVTIGVRNVALAVTAR
ncbi:MAG: hypothetical protein JST51_03665 [Armatimonadetes bacterium]|nr:hypothetical protein [Armatimonadota bacterium]